MKKDELNECVQAIPLFNKLNLKQQKALEPYLSEAKFREKKLIYAPGDTSENIYFLKEGKIRIYRLSTNGKEQTIRFVYPGEFTGEIAFFKGQKHFEAYAEAYINSRVCIINHEDFDKILDEYPTISTKIMNVLAERLSSSEKMTSSIATEEVRTRVAHLFVNTAQFNNGEYFIVLDTAKKDWASLVGTTPESFSRALTSLEKSNIISEDKNRIIIKNMDALKNI